jgi:hypothetical protein
MSDTPRTSASRSLDAIRRSIDEEYEEFRRELGLDEPPPPESTPPSWRRPRTLACLAVVALVIAAATAVLGPGGAGWRRVGGDGRHEAAATGDTAGATGEQAPAATVTIPGGDPREMPVAERRSEPPPAPDREDPGEAEQARQAPAELPPRPAHAVRPHLAVGDLTPPVDIPREHDRETVNRSERDARGTANGRAGQIDAQRERLALDSPRVARDPGARRAEVCPPGAGRTESA